MVVVYGCGYVVVRFLFCRPVKIFKQKPEQREKKRLPPLQPSYLMESLEREGLWKLYGENRSGKALKS